MFKFTVALLLTIMFTSGCSVPKTQPFKREHYALGTINYISIYDQLPESDCQLIVDQVFNRLDEIEAKITVNRSKSPKSEIIKLNNHSGQDWVKLSGDTMFVLRKGLRYSQMFQGSFDITVGPLVSLWGIGTDYANIPPENEIESALALVNYKHLKVKGNTAKLSKRGMKVDLGAVAKGYAADEALRILTENGISHAIVNLGGNICVLGSKPNDEKWKIGIQDPNAPSGTYIGIIELQDESIVTSGIYERYFEEKSKQYHHILSTSDGYPIDNDLASVSIITQKSIDADCFSTSVFTMGLQQGFSFVENLPNTEAIFITRDNRIFLTKALRGKLNLTNQNYKIHNY